jgi:hypothetical protein
LVGIGPPALVAEASAELVLERLEVSPAVERARVLVDLDVEQTLQLADDHHAAQPAAKVVLPVGQM